MEEICTRTFLNLKGQTWEYSCKDSHWDSWVGEQHVSVVLQSWDYLVAPATLDAVRSGVRSPPPPPPYPRPLRPYIRQDLATGYYLHDPSLQQQDEN